MKTHNLGKKFFLGIFTLVLLLPSGIASGQVKAEYSNATNSGKKPKIIDLTTEVKKKCTASIVKMIGPNRVEIRFQEEFREELLPLADGIFKVYGKTQSLMVPLAIENLRLYLLQIDDIPAGYKIKDEFEKGDTLLYFIPFKNKTDLRTGCAASNELCEELAHTLPHELAHGPIGEIFGREPVRWFSEALGDHIAKEVAAMMRPETPQEAAERNIGKAALYRFRERLWNWKGGGDSLQELRASYLLYRASEALLSGIIAESRQRGMKNTLASLFKGLQEKSPGGKKGSAHILAVIQEKLGIDAKNAGILNLEEKRKMIEDSASILSRGSEEERFSALVALAYIGDIPVGKDVLVALLHRLFEEKENAYSSSFAAMALEARLATKEYQEAAKAFLAEKKIKSLNGEKMARAIKRMAGGAVR